MTAKVWRSKSRNAVIVLIVFLKSQMMNYFKSLKKLSNLLCVLSRMMMRLSLSAGSVG